MVTELTRTSLAYSYVGVVGLSVSEFSNYHASSLMMNLADQKLIDHEIFAFKINRSFTSMPLLTSWITVVGLSLSACGPVRVDLQIHDRPKLAVHDSSHVPSPYLAVLQDVYYTGLLEVGTPPQRVKVMFDTRSSDVWLSSISACHKEKHYCGSHQIYDFTKSVTYKSYYGRSRSYCDFLRGVERGSVAIDNITIGGCQIKKQVFAMATELTRTSLAYSYDGVVGLSVNEFSNYHASSLMMNLADQKIIDQQIFAFKINSSDRTAVLTLGVSHLLYQGRNFIYANLVSDTRWIIIIDRILVNDEPVACPCRASPDPASSAIVGSPYIINPINRAFGTFRRHGWSYVDCKNLSTLPIITVIISKQPFTLGPEDYILEGEMDSYTNCWSVFRSAVSMDDLLLGLPFLQRYYTLYDINNKRIGFSSA